MRLGKFVEHFKAAAVAYDSKQPDPVLKFLAISRQLGYGFYLLLDNICYVDAAGIKKFEAAARLSKNAARAWFVGILSNVLAGAYTLYNLQQALHKQADNTDAEKAVEVKKLAKYVRVMELKGIADREQGLCFCTTTIHPGLLRSDIAIHLPGLHKLRRWCLGSGWYYQLTLRSIWCMEQDCIEVIGACGRCRESVRSCHIAQSYITLYASCLHLNGSCLPEDVPPHSADVSC